MFGMVAISTQADTLVRTAITTIASSELLQAFRLKANDKIGLRRIVQARLRVLKGAGVEIATLPPALVARCTAALQLR
eukprot:4142077-Heterocapsa_arctica.AAC.1